MKKNIYLINLIGYFFCFFLLAFFSFQSNAYAAPSSYFDTVQKTYIGYYQRPADPGGLIYWAGRLDSSGGDLTDIIEAFANSAEAQALYGTINSSNISTVVNSIYNTLFGRSAEAGGLSYYVNGFNSGQFTAATIMLNVLYGAQNEDLWSVNNKVTAANLFTRTIDPELDGANFLATYSGNTDAQKARDFLSAITFDPGTIPTQAGTTTYIKTNVADSGDPIMNYVTGLLADATNYTGSYPAAADVTFLDDDNVIKTVTAYPGQVQVFFSPSTDQSYAQSVIQSKGGTILSSIPLTGYYLAQVNIDSEGAFITSIRIDPQVRGCMPNLALELEQNGVVINEDYLTQHIPVPLNVHGPVAIDSGQHALDVVATAQANGGTITDIVNITRLQDNKIPGDKWTLALNAIVQGSAIFNPGATTFINVSQGKGYKDDELSGDTNGNGLLGDWSNWSNLSPNLQQTAINNRTAFMKNVLMAVESLPVDLFNNTFITMSAGNNNMPLDSMLSTLRANAYWDTILKTKNAIVTCPTGLYNQANQGLLGDPSIVVMTNSQAANGTSFASPAANAAVQHLTMQEILNIRNATSATFAQITKAADIAKAANPNEQVLPDEVQDIAEIIVAGGHCGDGICDPNLGEFTTTCPGDCPLICGDGFCNVAEGELQSCPQDCPQNQCCVDTYGCPSETPYECGASCCCCGWGQTCCWTAAGWVCCGG